MRDPGADADIVHRLIYAAEVESWEWQGGCSAILDEAANEIERLRELLGHA